MLMLLRVLVVVLLALAAARPTGRWGGPGGARSPVALAIVFDNSLSTTVVEGGRPLFAALRDTAQAALDELAPGDRAWIVTADLRLLGGTPASARAALDSMRPLKGAGDLAAALHRATSAVTGVAGHAPRMAVLSDGQRTAWPEPVTLPTDVAVIVSTPARTAPENRGVIQARPRPRRWTPRGTLAVGVHTLDSVPFRVLLHSGRGQPRTVARGVAGPREEVVLPVAAPDTGWIAGQVEIVHDELPGDDTRYFAVRAGAAPRVRAAPGAGPFVASALGVLRSERHIIEGAGIEVAPATELASGPRPALVTPPVQPARLGAANRALARRGIPWRFAEVRGGGRLDAPAALAGIRVHMAYELVQTDAAGFDTIAMHDGRPWAVGGTAAGEPYVVVASPLVPEASELPVRAAFVPWIATLLTQRLAAGEGDVVSATPRARLARPRWADSLRSADGEAVALTGAGFTAPASPGVHFFVRDGRRVGALVVNAEENESVLERMEQGEVAARIRGPQVHTTSGTRAWREALFAAPGVRSLVVPVLGAVLVLLLAELAVTMTRPRSVA